MWARVARFDGDPADVDARLERLRSALDAGTFASELADAKLLMLVDRESGGMIGVTLFHSEEVMRKADEVAIKVIVELQAKPGRRSELRDLLESMVADQRPNQPGFLGSTRYEALGNPDLLIEIADWESVEAREAHV